MVKKCYEHNGCSYLLQFSARLEQLSGFKFNDNWDGTTSMFDAKSGKLLVTFRNENMVRAGVLLSEEPTQESDCPTEL